jgi:hypothetical protein
MPSELEWKSEWEKRMSDLHPTLVSRPDWQALLEEAWNKGHSSVEDATRYLEKKLE